MRSRVPKLHNLILIGMVVGVIVGIALWWLGARAAQVGDPQPSVVRVTLWWLDLLGPTVFMGALKMIIAPLIFASIVAGVTSLPNLQELGAIGWKTLVYYITTTTIAVMIGLFLVLTVQPGRKPAAREIRADRVQVLEQRRQAYAEEFGEPAVGPDGAPRADYVLWLSLIHI